MTDNARLNLRISLAIDDTLTWAELQRFVDLARPHVNPEDCVAVQGALGGTLDDPVEMYVYLDEAALGAPAAE